MRPRSEDPKLIIRVINFELVQPICSRYVNVTDGRTDRQTDRRTTYDSNTALSLRASRGKNPTNTIQDIVLINPESAVSSILYSTFDLLIPNCEAFISVS